MFNFKINNFEYLEQVRDFAVNLVQQTRPYLTETQQQIIVEDLLNRVRASTNLIYDTEVPFKFGKNGERPRSRLSSSNTENDSAVGETSPRDTPNEVHNKKCTTETRKRCYRVSNACSSTPKVVQQPLPRKNISTKENLQKRSSMYNRNKSANGTFVSDIKAGAPAMKKKKPVTKLSVANNSKSVEFGELNCTDESTGKDDSMASESEQKSKKMPDVFERLYAARKPSSKNVNCKKNMLLQKSEERYKRRGSVGNDSLKECIGSVQKALNNLKLLAN